MFSRKTVVSSVLLMQLATLTPLVDSYPEQGKWDFSLSSNLPAVSISKSLYKNSTVEIKELLCHSKDEAKERKDVLIKITLLPVTCAYNFLGFTYVNSSSQNSASDQQFKLSDAATKKLVIPSDDTYLVTVDSYSSKPYNICVGVEIGGEYGYLSAIDWPLLPFYSTMCCVYVIYGFFWMIICFCYWRDLLRIQLWIGAVIFTGLVEKAVFVAEYESINESGKSVQGAVIVAEIVSCLKRTLARMLVIIASLGFGITKPRLGSELPKVTALGLIYFILSSAEAVIRVLAHKTGSRFSLMLAIIPLSVADALICWWIFTSLVQTIRTLILKKNTVKLALYRHFRNTMILAVIASVVYMLWSFKTFKLPSCITDWRDLWVDEAFWHVLFSTILLVIIILWRPSANNQRYAYTPLQDLEEGEEDDLVHDALGDVKKVRGSKSRPDSATLNEDEHLKWIEDNIPTSILDIELPGLLESDSEVNQHQVKISKML